VNAYSRSVNLSAVARKCDFQLEVVNRAKAEQQLAAPGLVIPGQHSLYLHAALVERSGIIGRHGRFGPDRQRHEQPGCRAHHELAGR